MDFYIDDPSSCVAVEMSRYLMVVFLVFDQIKVRLKAFFQAVFCLTLVLFSALFAGNTIYHIVAGTVCLASCRVARDWVKAITSANS